LQGDGYAFIHAGGTLYERELAPGEVLRVDTGCIVALQPRSHARDPVPRLDSPVAVWRGLREKSRHALHDIAAATPGKLPTVAIAD
jgi:Mitochondrial biogenesis AIM24